MTVLLVSNILGFVLGAVGLWATWILGDKSRKGWSISIGVEVGWIAYSLLINQWAVAVTSLAWVSLYARNWVSWKHEEEGRRGSRGRVVAHTDRTGTTLHDQGPTAC